MGILQKVKGALHYNWGSTPEEAEQNVIDNYKGFINANETKYTVYNVKYLNPVRKKAYSNKKR